jgi:hypothetical protein
MANLSVGPLPPSTLPTDCSTMFVPPENSPPGCLQSACWILRPASRNATTAYFLRQHIAKLSFLVGPLDRIVRVSGAVALHSQPIKAVARLCLVKTPKGREWLESFAPPPYRRGHNHDSFDHGFHTRLPASSPRLLGTRAHRAATSGECPTATAPRSDLDLLHGPTSLGCRHHHCRHDCYCRDKIASNTPR